VFTGGLSRFGKRCGDVENDELSENYFEKRRMVFEVFLGLLPADKKSPRKIPRRENQPGFSCGGQNPKNYGFKISVYACNLNQTACRLYNL
jgi:hypothetical protein